MHCYAGVGRTGVMVACYRMAVEGYSTQAALAEAQTFAPQGRLMPSQEKCIRDFGAALARGEFASYAA